MKQIITLALIATAFTSVYGAAINPSKPSLVGWGGYCRENNDFGTVGNRGFKNKAIDKWLDENMNNVNDRASYITHHHAMKNRLMMNFARDATNYKYYFCMNGGSASDRNEAKVTVEFKSLKEGKKLKWAVKQSEKTTYEDLPEGNEYQLKVKTTFTPGANPHGWCLELPQPEDTDDCFFVAFSDFEHLDGVYAIGPQSDKDTPLTVKYGQYLRPRVAYKFCPELLVESIFLKQCYNAQ